MKVLKAISRKLGKKENERRGMPFNCLVPAVTFRIPSGFFFLSIRNSTASFFEILIAACRLNYVRSFLLFLFLSLVSFLLLFCVGTKTKKKRRRLLSCYQTTEISCGCVSCDQKKVLSPRSMPYGMLVLVWHCLLLLLCCVRFII